MIHQRQIVSTLVMAGFLATALLLTSACKKADPIDRTKFEATYRAVKSIGGALEVGITYPKFGELLQTLVTEISITEDKVKTPEEKQLLGQYREIAQMYKDSYTIWKQRLAAHAYDTGIAGIPADRTDVTTEIRPLVAKYNLSTEPVTQSYTNVTYDTIANDSVQVIWAAAKEKMKALAENAGSRR